jgi:hypothetical protein
MTLSYGVYLGDKLLRAFAYDTRTEGDKERALKLAKRLVNDNKIFECDCTIEHFGISGVGTTVNH